jgi:hypothetical protein
MDARNELAKLRAEVERCNCVILQSTIDRQDEKRELERLREQAGRLTDEDEI